MTLELPERCTVTDSRAEGRELSPAVESAVGFEHTPKHCVHHSLLSYGSEHATRCCRGLTVAAVGTLLGLPEGGESACSRPYFSGAGEFGEVAVTLGRTLAVHLHHLTEEVRDVFLSCGLRVAHILSVVVTGLQAVILH
jgi:hypothetical protein